MPPQFIVVQSKEDYDREMEIEHRKMKEAAWIMFTSGLFSALICVFIMDFSLFIGFLFIIGIAQAVGERTKNLYIRSCFKAALGGVYGIWSLLFAGLVVYSLSRPDGQIIAVFGVFVAIAFFYGSYKNLSKYTRLFYRFSRK